LRSECMSEAVLLCVCVPLTLYTVGRAKLKNLHNSCRQRVEKFRSPFLFTSNLSIKVSVSGMSPFKKSWFNPLKGEFFSVLTHDSLWVTYFLRFTDSLLFFFRSCSLNNQIAPIFSLYLQ